jgi:hypothetical protein
MHTATITVHFGVLKVVIIIDPRLLSATPHQQDAEFIPSHLRSLPGIRFPRRGTTGTAEQLADVVLDFWGDGPPQLPPRRMRSRGRRSQLDIIPCRHSA